MDEHAVRPRSIAADRRAQRQRAEARLVQRIVKGLRELGSHKGCRRTLIGDALLAALDGDALRPSQSSKKPTAGMDLVGLTPVPCEDVGPIAFLYRLAATARTVSDTAVSVAASMAAFTRRPRRCGPRSLRNAIASSSFGGLLRRAPGG